MACFRVNCTCSVATYVFCSEFVGSRFLRIVGTYENTRRHITDDTLHGHQLRTSENNADWYLHGVHVLTAARKAFRVVC